MDTIGLDQMRLKALKLMFGFNMIELRWKEILSKIEHKGTRPVIKTVLQYRQQVNGQWTDWCDVPTIQEITN